MPQLIRPFKLAVSYAVVASAGSRYLVVTAWGGFRLSNPSELVMETDYMPAVAAAAGAGVHDLGMVKPAGEILIGGDASSPGGQPVQKMRIEAMVGPVTRRATVFGDRFWRRDRSYTFMSEAEPFARMPLTADRAFGGPGHPLNPAGRGHGARVLLDEGLPAPLPNLEDPDRPIHHVDEETTPLLFGPLPHEHPARLRHVGTYDWNYLQESWPEPPPDFDLRYYNVADPAQRIGGWFRGDEPVRLVGLSPTHPVIETALPGLRARVFLVRKSAPDTLVEIRTRLDTVWLVGSEDIGGVYFRGVSPVEHPLARDVAYLMAGYERLDEPRPDAHYAEVFRLRSDPEKAHIHAVNEEQLTPPLPEAERQAMDRRTLDAAVARKKKMEARLAYETTKALEEAGVPPELHPPMDYDAPLVLVPTREDLLSGRADIAALFEHVEELAAAQRADPFGPLSANPRAAPAASAIEAVRKGAAAVENADVAAFQSFLADDFGPELKALAQRERRIALDAPGPDGRPLGEPPPDDDDDIGLDIEAILADQDRAIDEVVAAFGQPAGQEGGDFFALARARALGLPEADPLHAMRESLGKMEMPAFSPEVTEALRRRPEDAALADAIEAGDPFALLAGGKPQSLDVGAIDATAAQLGVPPISERLDAFDALLLELLPGLADKPGRPVEALTAATAALPRDGMPTSRAEMDDLMKALTSDDAGQAAAEGAAEAPSAADGSERLMLPLPIYPLEPYSRDTRVRLGALIVEESARGRSFRGRDIAGAILDGASLAGIDLAGAFFETASLRAADLSGANLSRVALTGADLTDLSAADCDLSGANLSRAVADGADLSRARLLSQQMVMEASFRRTRLAGARLDGLTFMDCDFTDADLTEARLDGCTFFRCRLGHLRLEGARIRQTQFVDVDAPAIRFDGARMADAINLIRFRAPGASFRAARLANVYVIGEGDLTGADLRDLTGDVVSFNDVELANADFSGAVLVMGSIARCRARGARFDRARLRQDTFNESDFSQASFVAADLFESQLSNAVLRGATFRGASLYGAALSDSDLVGCDLTGANLAGTLFDLPRP